jgi:hypothetical protein
MMMDNNTLIPKKRPESVPPGLMGGTTGDLKRESIAQVINLLRTNTQNIFHLENHDYDPTQDPNINTTTNNNNTTSNNNTTTNNTNNNYNNNNYNSNNYSNNYNNNYNNFNSLAPPSLANKKISTLKERGHKYSKSATTSADFKSAVSLSNQSNFQWDSRINEGKGGGAAGDGDLLGVGEVAGDWMKGRPRSYSESTSSPLSFLDSDPNSPSLSPTISKKKGKKEKRSSKPLAPVMPFTSNKRGSIINDKGDGIISINVADTRYAREC